MRVLVVVNHLVPDQLEVWRGAADSGVDVVLAGALDGRSGEAFPLATALPDDLQAYSLRPRSLRPGQDSLWWVFPQLYELVDRIRPDVIHIHSEAWGLLALQVSKAGLPFVVHGANNLVRFGSALEHHLRMLCTRHVLRRSSGYVSWNSAGLRWARANGLAEHAATAVVPGIVSRLPDHAVPGEERLALRRRWTSSASTVVVGFLGRADPEKGIEVLCSAWHSLVSQPLRVDAELVLIGRGTERYASLPHVHAQGVVGLQEAQELLSGLDVLVVPSVSVPGWQEQFGRVVTEAFARGVAVITSDSGALPEVVGNAGLVVPEGDAPALAAAIRALVEDDDLRAALAAAGRRRRRDVYHRAVLGRTLSQVWRASLSEPQVCMEHA